MKLRTIALIGVLAIGGRVAVAADGAISGVLVNASRDSAGIPGAEVLLRTYAGDRAVEGGDRTARTGATGRFSFAGLETRGTGYSLHTVHEGRQVDGPSLQLTDIERQQEVVVPVHDATASDSAISEAMHHIVIEPGAGGALAVREIIVFANTGTLTYVGAKDLGEGKRAVLAMEIPSGATDLQTSGDIMSCCAVVDGNRVFDTMEIPPGHRQITLSYLLPYRGGAADFAKILRHRSENVDIFVPEAQEVRDVEVETGGASVPAAGDFGPTDFPIRGATFRRYQVGMIPAGAALAFTVANLPGSSVDYRMIAPVALVAIIVPAVLIVRRRRRVQVASTTPSAGDAERSGEERIVEEIVSLDVAYERGEIDEQEHRTRREALMRELRGNT